LWQHSAAGAPFRQISLFEDAVRDAGYQGRQFQQALAAILPSIEAQIIKRPCHAKGFVHLPKRWIVERTIAWLNRCEGSLTPFSTNSNS